MKLEQQQRMYDTLKRISKGYMTPDQLRRQARRAETNYGFEYEEALEMAYENIQAEAAAAIKGLRRRPSRNDAPKEDVE